MPKNTMLKVILVFGLGITCALVIRGCLLQKREDTTKPLVGEEAPFQEMESVEKPYSGKIIVIDPGHGGVDPGKVGVKGTLEKDINLEISLLLKKALEEEGMTVVMTRQEDKGLYEESSSNKKMQDLKERLAIIDGCSPELVVSIHQNSYTDASVCGPQIFYHESSEKGAIAAGCLQKCMNEELEIARPRTEKANDNYYLLTKCEAVMVIAECGFLSNPKEEALLQKEEYQERIVKALKEGICTYFDKQSEEIEEPQI